MLESIPLDFLPEVYRPYFLPAAILHVALFFALIVPTWRAFSRAGAGGFWALLLIFPGLGLLLVALIMAGGVLRRAGWSPVWFILVLVPVVNVLFLWIFAFAPWRKAQVDSASGDVPSMPEPKPATDEPSLSTGKPMAAHESEDEQEEDSEPRLRPAAKPVVGYAARPVGSADPNIRKSAEPVEEPDDEDADIAASAAVGMDANAAAEAADLTDEYVEPESSETLLARTGNGSREPITTPLDGGRVWVLTGGTPDSRDDLRFRVLESQLRAAPGGLTIGRASSSDFIISHQSVSRAHARLLLKDRSLHVEDLDSMNGTYIDGERLAVGEAAELNADSKLEFGKIKFNLARN